VSLCEKGILVRLGFGCVCDCSPVLSGDEIMNVELKYDRTLGYYDTGGGCCDLTAIISIDPGADRDMQRRAVIHEAMEAMFGFSMTHDQIQDAEDVLCDALEQWEGYEST